MSSPSTRRSTRGAVLTEAVIVLPVLLLTMLVMMQIALLFHAKSSVNYAIFEAARAGSTQHADIDVIKRAFQKAMVPYYGGGRNELELVGTTLKMQWENLAEPAFRIRILSPSRPSFEDYNSPALQESYRTGEPVIPSVGLAELRCPRDVPDCNSNPTSNRSGQSLKDANLLKLHVTFGVPPSKQLPIVGRIMVWALARRAAADGDAFELGQLATGRIPIVASAVIRMQSDPIRNDAM